jgi:hypothetical protein
MRFPILISYAMALEKSKLPHFDRWLTDETVDVLVDSGAFTAKNKGIEIKLDSYCTFLDANQKNIFRYLALDKVGDPQQTERNLKEMLRCGYKPVPVHVLGDDQRRMDELFEYSDYVACAGLRRPHKGQCPREYVKAKAKWANGRPVHWLGYTKEHMLIKYRPYSCDSASHSSAAQYGEVRLYLGNGHWLNFNYDRRKTLLNHPRALGIVRDLGFTVQDINDPWRWRSCQKLKGDPPQRELSGVVTTDSYVRYVIDVWNKFRVRYFLAICLAGEREYIHVHGAIQRNLHKINLDPNALRRVSSVAGRA